MDLYTFDRTGPTSAAIDELIAATRSEAAGASLAVHPDDDMLAFSIGMARDVPLGTMAYFRAGLSIVGTLDAVATWRFGGLSGVGSVLDFAAGYGRSTRFLARLVDPSRVRVGEIQLDALEFQAREFGVATVRSETDPEAVRFGEPADIVFVSSLFTHLPRATFGPWLAALWQAVAPGGVLVFSTHDEAIAPAGVELVDGFAFQAASEVASLSGDEYGTNHTSARFVRDRIAAAIGVEEAAAAVRLPRALCFQQDVWVVCRGEVPAVPLQVECGPTGHLDEVGADGRRLSLRGWAADRGFCDEHPTSHAIREVAVRRNGRVIGVTTPATSRTDVAAHLGEPDDPRFLRAGWEITVDARGAEPDDVITAVAECEHGARFVVDAQRLADLFARCGSTPPPWEQLAPLARRRRTARRLYAEAGLGGVVRYSGTRIARMTRTGR